MSEVQVSNAFEDRNVIDGVPVVARQKACMVTPSSNGVAVEHRDIDECLLEDGRTVYQCAHRNEFCNKWWGKPESVRAHAKTHADRMVAKRLRIVADEAEQARIAAETELAARIKRKSEGSKRGAVTRRMREAAQTNGQAPVDKLVTPSTAQVQAIGAAIEGAIDLVVKMADDFYQVKRSLETTLHQLSTLEPIAPVDPDVLEKAASFDAMQKLLQGRK